jgi:hypothetical protein
MGQVYQGLKADLEYGERATVAWTVLDFFNLLKVQFTHFRAIPISPVKVFDGYNLNFRNPKVRSATPFLQKIYRDHG